MSEVIDNVDVVKVGTNVLVNKLVHGDERLNSQVFADIGRQAGGETNMVIVSSAAITAGMLATHTTMRPDKRTQMPELQRLASIGWRHILNEWDDALFRKTCGGLLLTKQELAHRHEREEALHVIHALLSHHEVPIVNENDAITHEEIAFGDNDTLAATLAAKIAKSPLFGKNVRLFLLTDVGGVYKNINDPSTRVPMIGNIQANRHLAGEAGTGNGTGGMITKFDAAEIAQQAGVNMWIYNPAEGHRERAVRGEIGTYFPAASE